MKLKIGAIIALVLFSIFPINAEKISDEDSRKFDYFFMEACRLKMKGEYQKSAEMFESCIKLDGESAASYFEIGKLLLMSRNEANAINFLKRAASLNPQNEWYQVYLAKVYERSEQYEQAIEVYKNLRQSHPAKVAYCYHLGDLYTKTKLYHKAIEVYDELEKLEGMDEDLVLEKERLYLLLGNKKKAYGELNKLLKEYPNEARYVVMKGDYYATIGNYKKAQKAYDKAASMDPDNGFLHLSLSMLHEKMGDQDKAMGELKISFASEEVSYEQKIQILLLCMRLSYDDKLSPSVVEDLVAILKKKHPEQADTYYYNGSYHVEDSTKVEQVFEDLEKAVDLNETHEEAWMLLIRLAFAKDSTMRVISYSDDAELAGVKTPHLYFYRGIASLQLEDIEGAKASFTAGMTITPDDNPLKPTMLGSLGDTYYQLGEAAMAFSCYESALALDEHTASVLNNYAYYLSEEDTLLAKAEQMSARCIELEPGNATYLDTYAWILYMRNNMTLAKFYMEKAINNINEPNDTLYDHYADILYANDDKELAREYWQKAIDAGGDKEIIGKKLLKK